LSTAQLAASHDLPRAYLNKQLQALAQAGLLVSTPGVRGGFRLARPPEAISLLDVVEAIEGPQEAFRCTEIRQRGAGRASPASCGRSLHGSRSRTYAQRPRSTPPECETRCDKRSGAVRSRLRRPSR
jgi:DNA-binding IscR family transcriptional regulator